MTMSSSSNLCQNKWRMALLQVQAVIADVPVCHKTHSLPNNWLYCLDVFTSGGKAGKGEAFCEINYIWPAIDSVAEKLSTSESRALLKWRWPEYYCVYSPNINNADCIPDKDLKQALSEALYLSVMSIIINYEKTIKNMISEEGLAEYSGLVSTNEGLKPIKQNDREEDQEFGHK